MNRAKAAELVRKLHALGDPARGGTRAECATANRKAARLIVEYGLEVRDLRPPVPPFRPFTAPAQGAAWFDHTTGAHSPNVQVHRYNSPRDWRIEIQI